MTESSTNALAKLICDFCFETMQGHESGMYKFLPTQDLDDLLTPNMIFVIKDATLNYLNEAYKSLILKSDPYIQDKFDAMCKVNGHSEICLLNIIAAFIMNIHISLDRSKFDISSYDTYMQSVMVQLNAKRETSLDTLSKSISHKCTGTDISTCDPNQPMFF